MILLLILAQDVVYEEYVNMRIMEMSSNSQ
jgi:hypothetical protein